MLVIQASIAELANLRYKYNFPKEDYYQDILFYNLQPSPPLFWLLRKY